MAQEKDIKIKIILNDGGTSATLKNINNQIISSKVPIKELRKELGNFVVTSKKIENSVNVNRKQFNSLGKSVGGFTSQTGAATSATLEFGRVLSDAPYGIRGVANKVLMRLQVKLLVLVVLLVSFLNHFLVQQVYWLLFKD